MGNRTNGIKIEIKSNDDVQPKIFVRWMEFDVYKISKVII